MIIGVGHKKRQGKSTIARILVRDWNFQEFTFATPIKEMVDTVFNFPPFYKQNKEEVFSKVGISYRDACQKIGESFRQTFGSDVWVKCLERKLEKIEGDIVISDVRHVEEADWVKSMGGTLIKVFTSGTLEDGHISENGLNKYDNWNFLVKNDGSIGELEYKIEKIMSEIFSRKLE